MWPFERKPIVAADTATWHLENFTWLVREFEPENFAKTQLIFPRPGFFPTDGEQGHALAARIFEQVKRYCDMAHWEVDLVADHNPLAQTSPLSAAMIAPQRHAVGMFMANGNRIQVSYVPELLRRPERFIATMAHELAHYLLATARHAPPCADDETEFLTDLAAVYLGFGVFLANARFEFEVLSDGPMQGWRIGHTGYLQEADLVYALALFLRTKDLDPEPACDCLKPHLAKMLKRALKMLPENEPGLVKIRALLA